MTTVPLLNPPKPGFVQVACAINLQITLCMPVSSASFASLQPIQPAD